MSAPDEFPDFWLNMSHAEVAHHAAALQKFHRQQPIEMDRARMIAARQAMSSWLHGTGIEVGAGDRPFQVRDELDVIYGDVRDDDGLKGYFGKDANVFGGGRWIDAQTFSGVLDESVDFVISAHVIEHLFDPMGSIEQAIRIIKPGGLYLLAVPDKRYIFDRDRPDTPLSHVVADYADGGEGTKLEAYIEVTHYTHGHPMEKALALAEASRNAKLDIHVHAWTQDGFRELLEYCTGKFNFFVEAYVLNNNENIFMLRKRETIKGQI